MPWQSSPSHYLYLAGYDLAYHSQVGVKECCWPRRSVVLFYVLAERTVTHWLATHYGGSLGLVSLISGPAYVFGVGPGESSAGSPRIHVFNKNLSDGSFASAVSKALEPQGIN